MNQARAIMQRTIKNIIKSAILVISISFLFEPAYAGYEDMRENLDKILEKTNYYQKEQIDPSTSAKILIHDTLEYDFDKYSVDDFFLAYKNSFVPVPHNLEHETDVYSWLNDNAMAGDILVYTQNGYVNSLNIYTGNKKCIRHNFSNRTQEVLVPMNMTTSDRFRTEATGLQGFIRLWDNRFKVRFKSDQGYSKIFENRLFKAFIFKPQENRYFPMLNYTIIEKEPTIYTFWNGKDDYMELKEDIDIMLIEYDKDGEKARYKYHINKNNPKDLTFELTND